MYLQPADVQVVIKDKAKCIHWHILNMYTQVMTENDIYI